MSNTGWTPNITGLIRWDQLTDQYDSSQLANNWTAVDAHDHTTNKGVKVPNAGLVNNTVTIGSTSVALGATATTIAGLTLTTPNIGAAIATSVNKVTITVPTTSATLTLADNSTFVTIGAYSTTLRTTATTDITLPTTGTVATTLNKISDFASSTSSELAGKISDETGTGSLVFGTSPSLTTPKLTGSTNPVTIASAQTATGKTITFPNVSANANVITSLGYGTSLPSSPADGDEYYYSTSGYVWHLRYTTGLNKWQFVGGSALIATENGTSNLTATTYTYNGALMASPYGPSLTVPTGMTGIYKVEFGMDVSNTNANKVNYMNLFTSATGNTSPLGSNTELIVANADTNTGANPATYTASKIVHNVSLTATNTIYAQFKTSANTATVSNRYISITPVTIG